MIKKFVLLTACLGFAFLAVLPELGAYWPRWRSVYSSCYSVSGPVYYEVGDSVSLFNGTDLTGWTNAEGEAPGAGWGIEDGAISRMNDGAGDLFTEKSYTNFILEFEFKVAPGTNSGLKYRLWKEGNTYYGTEYQIYEPENGDGIHESSAVYDLFAPNISESILKRDDYNQAKIVVKGNHIEHWLNGVCTVSVLVNSPEWYEHLAKSKFAKKCGYGQYRSTRLFFQDHGTPVWLKNITIRELKPLCQ